MTRINLSGPRLRDYEWSSRREWLVANGIGGYASASVAGANTRRYHGLLVAALTPPTGRTVVLSRLEESLAVNGQAYELSCSQYPGLVSPAGYRYLDRFLPWPAPTFEYALPCGVRLRKRIWMALWQNTTFIRYELGGAGQPKAAELKLTPLVCWKDYHGEMAAREGFPVEVASEGEGVAITPLPGQPALRLQLPGARWTPGGCWYYRFEHLRELERGLEWHEDLYSPGGFTVLLARGESVTLTATLEESPAGPLESWSLRSRRQRALAVRSSGTDDLSAALVRATDSFVVERGPGMGTSARSTIIAGYPWFADWGRDTMISLPGLCMATGRFDTARDILHSYAGFLSQGMIPNRFPDSGEEPEYNTADATLWYVNAIWQLVQVRTGGVGLAREMWPVLREIVDWHVRGTRWGIQVDPADGLLHAGEPDSQLTWMDARVNGIAVTPRVGKPVEINALWHNALMIAAEVAAMLGEDAEPYRMRARQTAAGFRRGFVRPDGGGLFDVLTASGPDVSVRPNQVFSLSLPFPPLPRRCWKQIVDAVGRDLLTPVGLRTLAPGDPGYRGRYAGSPAERDGAYHQGTVWPWLLGPFMTAHYRAYKDAAAARALAAQLLERMNEYGVGYLPEVYDGDAPHSPGGCIAQAWSTATILEALKAIPGSERGGAILSARPGGPAYSE